MATERITILVDSRGERRVVRSLQAVGAAGFKAGQQVRYLTRGLYAYAAGSLVRGLMNLADSFTNTQNRIGTVTKSQAQLNAVTERVFAIANNARVGVDSVTETYVRMARGAEGLGYSQERLLGVTQTLTKAVSLSGATAAEAHGALLQLSQGMASGQLRGQELNSVLEQTPEIARLIAKQMGATAGQLKKLGQEGKITTKVIIDAMESATAEVDAAFAKTIPTFGQVFQVLRNRFVQWMGTNETVRNATRKLAEALLWASRHMDELARARFHPASAGFHE